MLGRAGLKAILEGGSELLGMLGRRGASAEVKSAAKGAVRIADKFVNAGSAAVKKAAAESSEKGFGKWLGGSIDKHKFLSYAIAGGVPAYVGWRTARDDDHRAMRAGIFGAGGLYLLSRFRNPKALAKLAEAGKNFKAGATGEWALGGEELVSHEYRTGSRVTTRLGPLAPDETLAKEAFDKTAALEGEEAAKAGVEVRETKAASRASARATPEQKAARKAWTGERKRFDPGSRTGESRRTYSIEVDKRTGKRHKVRIETPVSAPASETVHGTATVAPDPTDPDVPFGKRHYPKTLGFDPHRVERTVVGDVGRWEGRGEKFGEGFANFGEFLYGGRKWTALHSMAAGALYGAASNDDTILGGATKGLAIHIGVRGLVHNVRGAKRGLEAANALNRLEGKGFTEGEPIRSFFGNIWDIAKKRASYRTARMKPSGWVKKTAKWALWDAWAYGARDIGGSIMQGIGDAIKKGTEDEIAEGIAKSDGFFARLTEGYGKNRRAINRMPLIRGGASAGLILGAAGASRDDGEPAGPWTVVKGSAKGIAKGAAIGIAGRAATALPGAAAIFGATLGLQAVAEGGEQLRAWRQSGGPAGRPLNADGDLTLALHKIRHAY